MKLIERTGVQLKDNAEGKNAETLALDHQTVPPKPRILIVEDEAIVACDIQTQLEACHFEVPATASSGEQALRLAAETMPDLVLMDIKLRGDLNGVQVADIIRRQYGIPIVFLTANSEEEMLQRAKVTEPLAYVLKPYSEKELRIAVEFALYRGKMERERERLTRQLEQALAEAKILRGLIPFCAWCRKIRTDQGAWLTVEAYLEQNTNAVCSHGICPECLEKVSPKNA
ncbi:MAG TPA: response regulator [Verrucomicrobiae bacterium]